MYLNIEAAGESDPAFEMFHDLRMDRPRKCVFALWH